MAVFLDGIPFVHHHHAGAAVFFDAAGQALILFGDAIEGINHQHADIGALDGLETAVNAEVLGAVIHRTAAANAGRIQQFPGFVFPLNRGVDGVAGGAPDRAHDRPVLTANRIQQAGFPHIGPANNRQLDGLLLAFDQFGGRQKADHLVEQIAGAGTVDR